MRTSGSRFWLAYNGTAPMRTAARSTIIAALAALILVAPGLSLSSAQPRPHVYLLRGLMNIFSLGMDTLAEKLQQHGIYATLHNYVEWPTLADQAAAAYKAGSEGPIILIGHSLGADAVMEMAANLGERGVPVALVVPFDATKSFAASRNVGRLLNLTQREYAYMRPGRGFHGSLVNVDVSSDPSIDHINIDKSARLHARVVREVLAVIGSAHRSGTSTASNHDGAADQIGKPADSTEKPLKHDKTVTNSSAVKTMVDGGTSPTAQPRKLGAAPVDP